jgi:hypothetical protein
MLVRGLPYPEQDRLVVLVGTVQRIEVACRSPVTFLSHALWMRRFGGDPSIVGRTVRLDAATYEVIGVDRVPSRIRHREAWYRELDSVKCSSGNISQRLL